MHFVDGKKVVNYYYYYTNDVDGACPTIASMMLLVHLLDAITNPGEVLIGTIGVALLTICSMPYLL